jgi:hypothetical protein
MPEIFFVNIWIVLVRTSLIAKFVTLAAYAHSDSVGFYEDDYAADGPGPLKKN